MMNTLDAFRNHRVLLTNDDGLDAPGLAVLEAIARTLFDDVWVLAPDQERSGVGHGFTLTRPLRVTPRGAQRVEVDGTPVDCVILALSGLICPPPDLVLSGVNAGCNLGPDQFYSGTCGAAREAALAGVPAIAFSQALAVNGRAAWAVATQWVPIVLEALLPQQTAQAFFNVNFPACAPDAVRGLAVDPAPAHPLPRQIASRVSEAGEARRFLLAPLDYADTPTLTTDAGALAAGHISVTRSLVPLTVKA